jgi:outer membrane protein assembly factor BamB
VATLGGEVLQLSAGTGDVKNVYTVGSPVRAQPAIVNGRIYVGTQDGKVVCFETGDSTLTGWGTWGKDSRHSGTGR